MAIRPSQTNVNKCATVTNVNLPKGTTGGVFRCGVGTGSGPRSNMPAQQIPNVVGGQPGGNFATQLPGRPRIDSILPKGYIK